jgi:2-polyprenyl-3-methyl-5-hydroxy-6-metoxy-1,4-benzoquinol methylase
MHEVELQCVREAIRPFRSWNAREPLSRSSHFLNNLRRLKMLSGSILEIGYNSGDALRAFEGQGWTVANLEINRTVKDAVRPVLNVPISASISEILQEETFNVILVNSLLQQLRHPRELIRALLYHLKPRGFLYVTVPNYGSVTVRYLLRGRWKSLIPAQNFWYFDRHSLANLFRSQNLEAVRIYTRNRLTFLPYDGDELAGIFRVREGRGNKW